ncbi:outer membrane beta-barrel protein [Flaviaesturariibacter amylovorans]|uniref:Outer membrane beta-barrel family protein n=1 Tax=Flaviaesturariibacter amylovorans TaxID=1084520 RepID=A0ABP8HHB5_9BACT
MYASFRKPAFLPLLFLAGAVQAQEGPVTVEVREGSGPLAAATVEVLSARDSALVKVGVTDARGAVSFPRLPAAPLFLRVSHAGFSTYRSAPFTPTGGASLPVVRLQPASGTLAGVTVASRRPFVEQKPGKTIVNLESSISAVGTSVAEALERLPGVSMDRNGSIALKGRPGVAVYIDGKATNLSGAELATLLQGMSASGISQIELMDQPPARYEAAGGAGVINIITKKTKQSGFNGSLSTALTQGRYPKSNNNAQLAWRGGRWSISTNYSLNAARNYTDIEALRTYYAADGKTVVARYDQPSRQRGRNTVHSLRTAIDYTLNKRTTLGLTLNGITVRRKGTSRNEAFWEGSTGADSAVLHTDGSNANRWRNGGAGLSLRHNISATRQLSVDLDGQWYRMRGDQLVENSAVGTGTFEGLRSEAPGKLRILSARVDWSARTKRWSLETGARWSDIRTDNEVLFDRRTESVPWSQDLGRSNHFLYHERIGALYGSAEHSMGKWTIQGGLRFEGTAYDARQLGNAQVKDSSFSRSYASLFPTLFVTWNADSSHTWTFSAGRRIDRPPFQKLNPFTAIINAYTVQRGNPYFRPQYSWNTELTHVYKGWLITGVGYSITTDYFAQLFPVDPGGLVVYTEGNLGKLQVLSANVGVQRSPTKWWSLNTSLLVQHKIQEGFVERDYTARITQATLNMTNSFRFGKGWSAELGGQYITRSQVDIQEVLDPSGQLSVGVAKSILKGQGTLRLAGRDLFHTQWIKGDTFFKGVHEWFKVSRDTRVVALAFQWRFGKAFKQSKRTQVEEMQRVGNG